MTGRPDVNSAKALVEDYESRRSGSEPLIFLGQRPFSGAFYNLGKAEQVPDAGQLAYRLANAPAFVVVKIDALASLPAELRVKLGSIARHGEFELLFSGSYGEKISATHRTPVPSPTNQ